MSLIDACCRLGRVCHNRPGADVPVRYPSNVVAVEARDRDPFDTRVPAKLVGAIDEHEYAASMERCNDVHAIPVENPRLPNLLLLSLVPSMFLTFVISFGMIPASISFNSVRMPVFAVGMVISGVLFFSGIVLATLAHMAEAQRAHQLVTAVSHENDVYGALGRGVVVGWSVKQHVVQRQPLWDEFLQGGVVVTTLLLTSGTLAPGEENARAEGQEPAEHQPGAPVREDIGAPLLQDDEA